MKRKRDGWEEQLKCLQKLELENKGKELEIGLEKQRIKKLKIETELKQMEKKPSITTGVCTYMNVGEEIYETARLVDIEEILNTVPRTSFEELPDTPFFIIKEFSESKKTINRIRVS